MRKLVAGFFCLAVLAGGCSKSESGSAEKSGPKAVVPDGVFLAAKPDNARAVLDVKQTANVGDSVVVRGRIAGSKEPFSSGRAMFTLADAKLPLCSESETDKCPTPWDLCCEPKQKLAENTLTIELDDASGKALPGTLLDVGGLAPGKAVIVKGKVVQKPTPTAMTIRAEGIALDS